MPGSKLAHQVGFDPVYGACIELRQGASFPAMKDRVQKTMADKEIKIEDNERFANLRLEYQEISHWGRHIEVFWWGVGAILLPVTAGGIYYGLKGSEYEIIIVGVPLVIIWALYLAFTKFIYELSGEFRCRLRKIEGELKEIKFWTDKKDPKSFWFSPIQIGFHTFLFWTFITIVGTLVVSFLFKRSILCF